MTQPSKPNGQSHALQHSARSMSDAEMLRELGLDPSQSAVTQSTELSPQELRRRFRKLARAYHPDINNSSENDGPENLARFRQLCDTYRQLRRRAKPPLVVGAAEVDLGQLHSNLSRRVQEASVAGVRRVVSGVLNLLRTARFLRFLKRSCLGALRVLWGACLWPVTLLMYGLNRARVLTQRSISFRRLAFEPQWLSVLGLSGIGIWQRALPAPRALERAFGDASPAGSSVAGSSVAQATLPNAEERKSKRFGRTPKRRRKTDNFIPVSLPSVAETSALSVCLLQSSEAVSLARTGSLAKTAAAAPRSALESQSLISLADLLEIAPGQQVRIDLPYPYSKGSPTLLQLVQFAEDSPGIFMLLLARLWYVGGDSRTRLVLGVVGTEDFASDTVPRLRCLLASLGVREDLVVIKVDNDFSTQSLLSEEFCVYQKPKQRVSSAHASLEGIQAALRTSHTQRIEEAVAQLC
jgi:hypothetical protein